MYTYTYTYMYRYMYMYKCTDIYVQYMYRYMYMYKCTDIHVNKMYEYIYRYLGGGQSVRCSRVERDCNMRAFRAPIHPAPIHPAPIHAAPIHAASTCPPKPSACLPVHLRALISSVLEFLNRRRFQSGLFPFFPVCQISFYFLGLELAHFFSKFRLEPAQVQFKARWKIPENLPINYKDAPNTLRRIPNTLRRILFFRQKSTWHARVYLCP